MVGNIWSFISQEIPRNNIEELGGMYMDHRSLLQQVTNQIYEILKGQFDRRLAKIFKKVNKINFEFINNYYRTTNEMINKKSKKKVKKEGQENNDEITVQFRHKNRVTKIRGVRPMREKREEYQELMNCLESQYMFSFSKSEKLVEQLSRNNDF